MRRETLDSRKFEAHSFVGTSGGFLSNHGTRAPKVTTAENHVERGAETAETGKDEVKSFAGTSEDL